MTMPVDQSSQESRPAVIWFVGIVAACLVVASVWGAAACLIAHQPTTAHDVFRSWAHFALYLLVAVGLFRRWKASRWAAVASLVVFAILLVCSVFVTPQRGSKVAVLMASALMCLVASLILATAGLLTFQPKVSRYFKSNSN
jgi:peptidoglycan/LPS O-acetylase OafA/YrhL